MSERVYTSTEAADLLRVGKRWLEDQARAGKAPHRRLGRKVLFSEADITALLDGAKVAADPNPWGRTGKRKAS